MLHEGEKITTHNNKYEYLDTRDGRDMTKDPVKREREETREATVRAPAASTKRTLGV